MKIFIYLYYFLRSVFLRGFLNTFALLKGERDYEKKFGIKTASLKKSNYADVHHYQGAGYVVLFRILEELEVFKKDHQFVDIGCGKGRVLFVAEYFGFNPVSGIELDEALLQSARENIKTYPFKRSDSTITLCHANALEVIYENRPTVYFLFNPFGEAILRKVINQIERTNLSGTIFVYMNPIFPGPFEEKGMERIKTLKTRWYTEAIVYCRKRKMV